MTCSHSYCAACYTCVLSMCACRQISASPHEFGSISVAFTGKPHCRENSGVVAYKLLACLTCIANVFSSITNEMQRYAIYLFLRNALHVSGGSSAHHQELKNCIYSIGYFVNPLVLTATTVAGSSKDLTKYLMLYVQF